MTDSFDDTRVRHAPHRTHMPHLAQCLRAFGFTDAYAEVKERENVAALEVLPDLLRELDAMDESTRLLALVEGVLAGNIFDWGSAAAIDLYKDGSILEIYRKARETVNRPWAVDHYDALRSRLIGPRRREYNRALLFCDNSGADVVLGMLPLARELLRRGTDVVLVANALPAINDVTAKEMEAVLRTAAEHCDVLAAAMRSAIRGGGGGSVGASGSSAASVVVVDSGSGSPCLDFRRVSRQLVRASKGVDLIVLEGMGRAVHTNYHAKFTCDALKLAMIKNSRLAERLFKGKIYDCMCKFDTAEERGGGKR